MGASSVASLFSPALNSWVAWLNWKECRRAAAVHLGKELGQATLTCHDFFVTFFRPGRLTYSYL